MKTTKILMMVSAAALGLAAVGCDSTSTCTDAGVCPDGGLGGSKGGSTGAGGAGGSAGLGGAGGGGPTLYGVTPGSYCFEVLAIAPGFVDGCDVGPDLAVSTPTLRSAIPVNYYNAATTTTAGIAVPAGTIEVGTGVSLGRGVISQNKATLLREDAAGMPTTDPTLPGCSWHQMDTSALELTATNTFTLAVTENETMITAACGKPAATCTSTWTWTLKAVAHTTLGPPDCLAPGAP